MRSRNVPVNGQGETDVTLEGSQLQATVATVLKCRKDLEFALAIQLKRPTSDLSLAIALLKRWNLWFGAKGSKNQPSSTHMFGRELAVAWQANPAPLLAIVDRTTSPLLAKLLAHIAGLVAENPTITAMHLLPLKEGEVLKQPVEYDDDIPDFEVAARAIGRSWLDIDGEDDWPNPEARAGYGRDDSIDSKRQVMPDVPYFGNRQDRGRLGSNPFKRGDDDSKQQRPQLPRAKSLEERQLEIKRRIEEQRRFQQRSKTPQSEEKLACDEQTIVAPSDLDEDMQKTMKLPRSQSQPELGREKKKTTRSIAAERRKRYYGGSPRRPVQPEAIGVPTREKDGTKWAYSLAGAKKEARTPESIRSTREHKRLAAKEKREMEDKMHCDQTDNKKAEWDMELNKRIAERHKAMYEHHREQRENMAHHQDKKEVLQLIVRVNYALHSGVVRSLNGVRVKDIRSLFEAMDTDKTGTLSQKEFADALKALQVNIKESSIEQFMKVLDNDMSGDLHLVELLKWWEQHEVTQAAAEALEDRRRKEADTAAQAAAKRRIHSSPSSVVAQVRAAMKAGRKLNGKTLTEDPRSFFEAIDVDHSGSIHPFELDKALKRLGIPMVKGDAQALVETINMSGGGSMNADDIIAWLQYQLVAAMVATQIRDVFDECRTLYGHSVTDADSFFEAIDLNGNGQLDFEEICDGLKKMQLRVGHPDLDAFLHTMGKDRDGLIEKAELEWALDHDNQISLVRGES